MKTMTTTMMMLMIMLTTMIGVSQKIQVLTWGSFKHTFSQLWCLLVFLSFCKISCRYFLRKLFGLNVWYRDALSQHCGYNSTHFKHLMLVLFFYFLLFSEFFFYNSALWIESGRAAMLCDVHLSRRRHPDPSSLDSFLSIFVLLGLQNIDKCFPASLLTRISRLFLLRFCLLFNRRF